MNTINATLDCIKETTTLTSRIVTNVCTGQVTVLPIGFWEFLGYGVSVILTLLFLGMLGGLCFLMIRDN
jgi:S-adenosylmethionine/arginine decarboxylase-like enzyme